MIIPIFNRSKWIGSTLDHILGQSSKVDEIILCDDGSEDDLPNALQPYGQLVKVIRIENSGPAVARKTAIEHSKGDWIALCDSDDFWYPEHIQRFRFARSEFPSSNFYFANFHMSNEPDRTKFDAAPEGWFESLTSSSESFEQLIHTDAGLYSALLNFQCCFQSACVFSRELYEAIGGITPEVSRWQAEDAHLTRRLAAYGDSVIDRMPGVIINKHDDNFSGNILGNFEGRIRILEKLLFDEALPATLQMQTRKEVKSSRLTLFRQYYWHGEYDKARHLFKEVRSEPLSAKDYLRFMRASLKSLI
ncbi:glycosyltransferase family 2 protein [Marinobacter changyiensis]|uniref:glycosyltransferase family 2 protein n=1 Tax=Marinobacter changyiensis TaxID=2604091 RepID=UPI0015D3DF70|nr:glycosyltransferase [Marinobacter changyiensis]